MMGNKKGAFTDLFLWMGIAFVIVLFMVIMTYVGTTTYNALSENAANIGASSEAEGQAIIDDTFGKVPNAYTSLRWISTMLIIGYALSIIVSSFLVKSNPVFFVPYVFVLILAVIISVPISNSYEVVYQNPTLASTFTGFFGATWIFLHLPIWVAVIGIIAGILMFINVLRGPAYL